MSGTQSLPVLPLRDLVIFPRHMNYIFVGREKSKNAVERAMAGDRRIFLVTQTNPSFNQLDADKLHPIGTIATVIQRAKSKNNNLRIMVQGLHRAQLVRFIAGEQDDQAEVRVVVEQEYDGFEAKILRDTVLASFLRFAKQKRIPNEVIEQISGVEDLSPFADYIVQTLNLRVSERQKFLTNANPYDRLKRVSRLLREQIRLLDAGPQTAPKSDEQQAERPSDTQEQEERDAREEANREFRELEEQIRKKNLSDEVREKATAELRKLKMMSPMSAEATVVRNYLDWVLALPWRDLTEDNRDIGQAERILEEDHFGLEKPKERILEYLAVKTLKDSTRGPILCFVGPPGVGKTSLGKSVARATGRNFVRVSLGGIRDEAEIRGHRRTYIGALPGKIIQGLKRAKSSNPVFLLDEVDKLSSDYRGDPSSALLEALDPEQNDQFNDHYIDLDYDLSRVLFVTTANSSQTIPPALLDRMEVINLPGYTEEEKLAIARQYLVPRQKTENGVDGLSITIADSAILAIIRQHTREAGVRNLEREIARILRKIAVAALKDPGHTSFRVTERNLVSYIGQPKHRFGRKSDENEIGVCTGLAWTETGGDILRIEVNTYPGKGKVTITGKLGEVMQESVQTALSYARMRTDLHGLPADFFEKTDFHIHVPEGAVPKEGPSAGTAIAVAILSALTGRPVDRNVAMTGEITLRGKVLPIGGLKEKLLGARRSEITTVLIPDENQGDLEEVPATIKERLSVMTVHDMDDVLFHALPESAPAAVGPVGEPPQPGDHPRTQ